MAGQGGLPDGFFTTGRARNGRSQHRRRSPVGCDYLHVLGAGPAVADGLPPAERDLFWFLCCLEEPDRERPVLDANWAGLWTRLGRTASRPAWTRRSPPSPPAG